MLVIGAGFGMTGTSSLGAALAKLMRLDHAAIYTLDTALDKNTADDSDAACWMRILDAKTRGETDDVKYMLKKLMKGYVGAVDWPACLFYRELMEVFPDAKVILTVRDKRKWYRSVKETLHRLRVAQGETWMTKWIPRTKRYNQFVDEFIWYGPQSIFKGNFEDEAYATEIMGEWAEEVKLVVPPDRLLVFSVSEGYPSLCDFLNLPEPKMKHLPKINEAKRFASLIHMTQQLDSLKYVMHLVIAIVVAFLLPRICWHVEKLMGF